MSPRSAARQLSSSQAIVDIQNTLITNALSSTGICSVFGGYFFIIKSRTAREELTKSINQRAEWVCRRKTMG
jgi:hypothetical protein